MTNETLTKLVSFIIMNQDAIEDEAAEEMIIHPEKTIVIFNSLNWEDRQNLAVEDKNLPEMNENIIKRAPKSAYSHFIKGQLDQPQLEDHGPQMWNIDELECWFHPSQLSTEQGGDGGIIQGSDIYYYLKKRKELKKHLSIADLYAIQQKGTEFFHEKLPGNYRCYCAWKSVYRSRSTVMDDRGDLVVPMLEQTGQEITLTECPLYVINWYQAPALRFK